MASACRRRRRRSDRVMRYHGSRQIASKRLEPSASYKYFDCSCLGVSMRSRFTSAANSAINGGARLRIGSGPELRIDIGIVRSEPVAETRSNQLPGGSGRGPLQHVVLTVEEVRGVFRIRHHRFETREGGE